MTTSRFTSGSSRGVGLDLLSVGVLRAGGGRGFLFFFVS